MVGWDCTQEFGKWCEHEDNCDCEWKEVCERCEKFQPPFKYKREHPDWVKHVLKDKSWAQWRKENPKELKALTHHKE